MSISNLTKKEIAYNARIKLHGQFANHGQHLAEAA
ncbi:hypothetical protein UFOVP237_10 [uncultured Caudovirales phage]|uniref:Uncharacterized protein n=1 Tax=uncultured Caudovirales phage TaxID=2100421 RepID=A0A6J7WQ26_9CAUD|nr:hypothetical protein UFOVP237_10 [uncultured Caudovirales phage]